MKNKDILPNYFLCIIFILLLIIPNAILLMNFNNGILPEFNSQNNNLIKEFKDYYSSNYGLKTPLANRYLNFKSDVLKETPLINRVVKGKNDWYFLGNYYNNTISDAYGNLSFEDGMLQKITNKIDSINRFLTNNNISFYVVIAPNKNSIYKENLPYKFKQKETRLQVLKSHLKQTIGFNLIDLTSTLTNKKNTHDIYIKSDTHWNDLGAYYGYEELMNEINKDYNIDLVSLDNYKLEREIGDQFELTRMINENMNDTKITLNKITPTKATAIKPPPNIHRHYINLEKDLKLILHRDSFANTLAQFLNESFGESYYLKGYNLNIELIKEFKPDIIIFEIVERNLENLAK